MPDPSAPTRRTRKKTETAGQRRRSEILTIAARLFAEHGFEAATIRQISDAAGILPGSLYHHFADKNAILHDLVRPFGEHMVAGYQAVVQRQPSPEAALRDLILFSVTELSGRADMYKIFTQEDGFFRRSDEFAYAWTYGQDIARIFHGVFQEGVRAGLFRADIDLHILCVLGLKMAIATTDWYNLDGRYSFEEVVDAQMDLLLNGLSEIPADMPFDALNRAVLEDIAAFEAEERSEAASDRRSEMLGIAAEIFAEHGFEATTIRQISEAAGILSSSVYHHFTDKYEVLHELIKPFGKRQVAGYQHVVRQPGPAEEALFRVIGFALRLLTGHNHLSRIIHREDKFFRRDPQFSYAWTYGQDVMRIFYGVIQEGVRSGRMRSTLRIDLVTMMMAKLISGTLGSDIVTGRYDLAEVTMAETKFLLNGLRGPR